MINRIERTAELDTLNERELIAYRNICLMSTKTLGMGSDRVLNARDLSISHDLFTFRGIPFELNKAVAQRS